MDGFLGLILVLRSWWLMSPSYSIFQKSLANKNMKIYMLINIFFGLLICIFIYQNNWYEVASICFGIAFVPSKLFWQRREYTNCITFFFMGFALVCLIFSDDYIVAFLGFLVVFVVYILNNFDKIIDFTYNKLFCDSTNFDKTSDFIYNKFIQRRK